MRIRRWSFLAFLLVLALGSTAWAAAPKFSAPKPFMLVLGDSLAFGFQQAKSLAGLSDPTPATFDTAFADVCVAHLANALASNYEQVLGRVRAAARDAEIIVLALFNPLLQSPADSIALRERGDHR